MTQFDILQQCATGDCPQYTIALRKDSFVPFIDELPMCGGGFIWICFSKSFYLLEKFIITILFKY